jgi:putative SOS response-associated peptidase YedK
VCGGYELEADPEALVSAFAVDDLRPEQGDLLRELVQPSASADPKATPEHFPRMTGPIILTRKPTTERPRPSRALGPARWGLVPPWADDLSVGAKLFNARSETLQQKPAFRDAFRSRRCIVPVSGFYEWKREGKRSQRFVFRASRGPFLALAGLWASWKAPSGERVASYTVITVPPNSLVAPIHDRMPAILSRRAVDAWLNLEASPAELEALLRPAEPGVLVTEPG